MPLISGNLDAHAQPPNRFHAMFQSMFHSVKFFCATTLFRKNCVSRHLLGHFKMVTTY